MEYKIEKVGKWFVLTEKVLFPQVWAIGLTLAEAKAAYYTAKYAYTHASVMSQENKDNKYQQV